MPDGVLRILPPPFQRPDCVSGTRLETHTVPKDNAVTDPIDTFTDNQRLTLEELRARYAEGHDRFTEREVAHLEFIRWLRETGLLRADPEAGDVALPAQVARERKHAKKSSGARTQSRHN